MTLVGSGGVGKTSASLKVGTDLGSRFKEGVWFVELAPLTDPNLIPEIISSLFNAPIGTGSVPIKTLSAILRQKQALLILDNCEHLVAAIASLAETIIHSCPNISILASSREPLTIAGETVYRVPSLTFPQRTDSITADEALSYSAVQLFAERGRAAVNGFVVANDNAPAVAEICRRLDGIALAIELAAPRLKMLKPSELANRLDDQFRILTGGSRTALPRQQTLRALIDWSYNLLSEPERILLRRLSVFAGGCTMDGAAAVAADHQLRQSDIFDLMASLVDALVALGLTMIFGLLDVINLAHGDLYMLGGYAAFTLLGWGAGYWGALVLVPLLIALVGWGLEELGIRPLLPRQDRAVVTLLLTFGVSLMLRDVAQVVWGTETHAVAQPFAGVAALAGVFVPNYRLFVFAAASVAIVATWWLVYRTRIGAVLRATATDPAIVASFGIPIRWVYGFTFMYGCGLAGLAGVLLSPIYAVFPTMGHDFLVMAFAVVIVGGMGSIVGAVVAALLLAQVQGLASLWIPPVWAETLVYGVMLLVLIVRPGGLFNRLGEA